AMQPIAMYGAEKYFVHGIVMDSVTTVPLPYASVIAVGANAGAVADASGIFEISVPVNTVALQISCVGYEKTLLPISKNSLNTYAVYLKPTSTELKEIVVHKERYSKRNNPAVEFLNRLKEQAPLTDPRRNDYYSYDKYERLVMGINNFSLETFPSLENQLPYLEEHVDTSEVSGKPYLSIIIKEKLGRYFYRKEPHSEREQVSALRSEGMDDMMDPAIMRVFMEEVMRDIDLYGNDINIFQNRFVSPLSRIAPDFYKFYLTDTVEVENERCAVLSFYPHNHAAFGFMGHVYVPVGDTTMFIRRVEMHVPREINLNFVKNLYINQSYTKAPDGSRLKMTDDMTAELGLANVPIGIYLNRSTTYGDHSFDTIPDSVYSGGGKEVLLAGAEKHDSIFWSGARMSMIKPGENNVGYLMSRLRSRSFFYWGEKVVKTLFTGYLMTGKPSRFDIGPLNAMLSFNSTEGTRLRAGGMTTAALSPRWFGRFYGAYGIKDHRWKYGAEIEYSFIDKDYHSREFPVKSIRFNSSYDIERPGENYLFTSPDNIVLSLKRMSDNRVLYKRLNRLQFTLETSYDFSVAFAISNIRRDNSATLQLVDGYGYDLGHVTDNSLELTLRYAPGEKFYQTRTYRVPANFDAPTFTLRHTWAPKGLFGARYGVNTTEIDVFKRWWFSAFGFLDTYIGAGHVWQSTSFLNLLIPNTNLSYIIQPRSFALMNPMEFINSTYVSFDFSYKGNGVILNNIPYIKDLKLREVFGFKGIWGRLSDVSNPADHPDLLQFPAEAGMTRLDHGPYMEASVGIDNIFKVLRVDYVWRLNYRDVPYKIDRNGIRIAVEFSF
ncbi:MAG: DUF5686 and carboxypeptidase regulatory-like domain-containing protein, partial [Muribaculaceae bacterium]|nr:DUF5686 and carboxypeptidase regulatory-like domain-containing protein [Muribaculaceae bacterium]